MSVSAERAAIDLAAGLALGESLHRGGDLARAGALYQGLIATHPGIAELHLRLGNVQRESGAPMSACDTYRRAVRLDARSYEARNNLALALIETGRAAEAAWHLREALRHTPDESTLHFNLGVALTELSALEDAASAYRRAIALRPEWAEAYGNLGVICRWLGRLDDASDALQQAMRLRPEWADAHANLGGVQHWQARHDEAIASHRRAIALAPNVAAWHGNLLFSLLFHPAYDARALRVEHERWARQHAADVESTTAHANDRTPERRLRVGYVSPYFREHVVGRHLLGLLREHDADAVEVFCYSCARRHDAATEAFNALPVHWRTIDGVDDDRAAELVRDDAIDILVDTALHMDGGRPLLFARKPAPVQVTFLGYPGSTGLRAIDYRITDPHLDPPGQHDDDYVEHSWRLPETFWCYSPSTDDPPVSPPPCLARGTVTFGCLNNFAKVNDGVLALWGQVLQAAPDSRLLLLASEGSHRERTCDVLAGAGIAPSRIEFASPRSRRAYLELFAHVDITLDPVPYNGHTTGLDSLWMGVPVVTLVGPTVVGRAGASQLANVSLQRLVARTPAEYVAIAAAMAGERAELAALRTGLRDRLAASPLFNAPRFARHVEAAYRGMWRRYCGRGEPAP